MKVHKTALLESRYKRTGHAESIYEMRTLSHKRRKRADEATGADAETPESGTPEMGFSVVAR